jgi:transposase
MPGDRRRTVNVREVLNAILYFVRTGCQWRNLAYDLRACLVKVHTPLASRLSISRIMATSMKVSLVCTIRS